MEALTTHVRPYARAYVAHSIFDALNVREETRVRQVGYNYESACHVCQNCRHTQYCMLYVIEHVYQHIFIVFLGI